MFDISGSHTDVKPVHRICLWNNRADTEGLVLRLSTPVVDSFFVLQTTGNFIEQTNPTIGKNIIMNRVALPLPRIAVIYKTKNHGTIAL